MKTRATPLVCFLAVVLLALLCPQPVSADAVMGIVHLAPSRSLADETYINVTVTPVPDIIIEECNTTTELIITDNSEANGEPIFDCFPYDDQITVNVTCNVTVEEPCEIINGNITINSTCNVTAEATCQELTNVTLFESCYNLTVCLNVSYPQPDNITYEELPTYPDWSAEFAIHSISSDAGDVSLSLLSAASALKDASYALVITQGGVLPPLLQDGSLSSDPDPASPPLNGVFNPAGGSFTIITYPRPAGLLGDIDSDTGSDTISIAAPFDDPHLRLNGYSSALGRAVLLLNATTNEIRAAAGDISSFQVLAAGVISRPPLDDPRLIAAGLDVTAGGLSVHSNSAAGSPWVRSAVAVLNPTPLGYSLGASGVKAGQVTVTVENGLATIDFSLSLNNAGQPLGSTYRWALVTHDSSLEDDSEWDNAPAIDFGILTLPSGRQLVGTVVMPVEDFMGTSQGALGRAFVVGTRNQVSGPWITTGVLAVNSDPAAPTPAAPSHGSVASCPLFPASYAPGIEGLVTVMDEFPHGGRAILDISGLTPHKTTYVLDVARLGEMDGFEGLTEASGPTWNPNGDSPALGFITQFTADGSGHSSISIAREFLPLSGPLSLLGRTAIIRDTSLAAANQIRAGCVLGYSGSPTQPHVGEGVNYGILSRATPPPGITAASSVLTKGSLVVFDFTTIFSWTAIDPVGDVTVNLQSTTAFSEPSGTLHGMHLYADGDLLEDAHSPVNTGHFNPTSVSHGLFIEDPRHVGDLDNYAVDLAYGPHTLPGARLTPETSIVGRAHLMRELEDLGVVAPNVAGEVFGKSVVGISTLDETAVETRPDVAAAHCHFVTDSGPVTWNAYLELWHSPTPTAWDLDGAIHARFVVQRAAQGTTFSIAATPFNSSLSEPIASWVASADVHGAVDARFSASNSTVFANSTLAGNFSLVGAGFELSINDVPAGSCLVSPNDPVVATEVAGATAAAASPSEYVSQIQCDLRVGSDISDPSEPGSGGSIYFYQYTPDFGSRFFLDVLFSTALDVSDDESYSLQMYTFGDLSEPVPSGLEPIDGSPLGPVAWSFGPVAIPEDFPSSENFTTVIEQPSIGPMQSLADVAGRILFVRRVSATSTLPDPSGWCTLEVVSTEPFFEPEPPLELTIDDPNDDDDESTLEFAQVATTAGLLLAVASVVAFGAMGIGSMQANRTEAERDAFRSEMNADRTRLFVSLGMVPTTDVAPALTTPPKAGSIPLQEPYLAPVGAPPSAWQPPVIPDIHGIGDQAPNAPPPPSNL